MHMATSLCRGREALGVLNKRKAPEYRGFSMERSDSQAITGAGVIIGMATADAAAGFSAACECERVSRWTK